MKRHALVALTLSASLFAQEDVLKPFRPNGNPAEPPRAVPVKPARTPEPEIPRAVPVKKPTSVPAEPGVVPAPRAVPADPVAPAPARTAPIGAEPRPASTQRPAPTESPELGDIVVRSGGTPTSADQVQLQYADGFYARKLWRDAAPEYERYLQTYTHAAAADRTTPRIADPTGKR